MKRVNLKEIYRSKQREMVANVLTSRSAFDHPAEKGAATELSWLKFLRTYLPTRYQVESGILIDATGRVSDQQDIVVLDRHYSPLILEHNQRFYMPAESAYAVFEIRQKLNRRNLLYAGAKVASVRELSRTSAPIPSAGGVLPAKRLEPIIGGVLTTDSDWRPAFGQPFRNALTELPQEEHLDLGCSLADGGFTATRPADGSQIGIGPPDVSLVWFLLTLLRALQQVATVAAIDYSEYLRPIERGEDEHSVPERSKQ